MRNAIHWVLLSSALAVASCAPPDPSAGACDVRDCGTGTCVDSPRGAYCDCPTGFHEEAATCVASPTDCGGVDCGAGGACAVVDGSATCQCEAGFMVQSLRCVPVTEGDPCADAQCGGGTCVTDASGARCECPEGQQAAGLRCVDEPAPVTSGLFVELPATGSVPITLYPDASVIDQDTWVSFGVPFPRGAVTDAAQLLLTDADGHELPAHVAPLLPWRTLGDASETSIRAVRVSVQLRFDSTDAVDVRLHWGTPRTMSVESAPDPWASWMGPVSDEYASSEGVYEPAVYATLPAEWLGTVLLRTRTAPLGADADLSWLDDDVANFSETAVNDVDPRVTADNLIHYQTDYEPWLFDRASTLFSVYARTGDVRWLRSAHRAAQFYAQHLDADGSFDLKGMDLKYSYGVCLLIDLMLTGDTRLVDPIERVGTAGESFNPHYTITTNFWTERHLNYALLAALTAWEATGEEAYATRIEDIVSTMVSHVASPPGGWTPQGCLLHTMRSHEGDDDDRPICSPWMSALLADGIWRYYLDSQDDRALRLLAGLGEFIATYGLYDAGTESAELAGLMVPWYLVSDAYQFTDSGAWADIEHTCDVGGLVIRAAWAKRQLGEDPSALTSTAQSLLEGCQRNIEMWVRPAGPESGLSVYRLSPPRKYNWWFGTTSDLTWMLGELSP